jgi:hypothetical protein
VSIAVGVDQTTNQRTRMIGDGLLLSRCQFDLSGCQFDATLVFSARGVLRKQTRPVRPMPGASPAARVSAHTPVTDRPTRYPEATTHLTVVDPGLDQLEGLGVLGFRSHLVPT